MITTACIVLFVLQVASSAADGDQWRSAQEKDDQTIQLVKRSVGYDSPSWGQQGAPGGRYEGYSNIPADAFTLDESLNSGVAKRDMHDSWTPLWDVLEPVEEQKYYPWDQRNFLDKAWSPTQNAWQPSYNAGNSLQKRWDYLYTDGQPWQGAQGAWNMDHFQKLSEPANYAGGAWQRDWDPTQRYWNPSQKSWQPSYSFRNPLQKLLGYYYNEVKPWQRDWPFQKAPSDYARAPWYGAASYQKVWNPSWDAWNSQTQKAWGPAQKAWEPIQQTWNPTQKTWNPTQKEWDSTQKAWDQVQKAWDSAQKTWNPAQKAWDPTQKAWDSSQKAWDPIQDAWDSAQKTWDPTQKVWDSAQAWDLAQDWDSTQKAWDPSQKGWEQTQKVWEPTQKTWQSSQPGWHGLVRAWDSQWRPRQKSWEQLLDVWSPSQNAWYPNEAAWQLYQESWDSRGSPSDQWGPSRYIVQSNRFRGSKEQWRALFEECSGLTRASGATEPALWALCSQLASARWTDAPDHLDLNQRQR